MEGWGAEAAYNFVEYRCVCGGGGGQAETSNLTLDELMQLPYGKRRHYHDDLTIVVVFFKKAQ